MSRIICNSCGYESEWVSASGEAIETTRVSVWGSVKLIVTRDGLVTYDDFQQDDQDYIDTLDYEFQGVEEYECLDCGATARDPNEIFVVMMDGCTCSFRHGEAVTDGCPHHGTTESPKDGNPEDEVVLQQHQKMPAKYALADGEEFVWTGERRYPRMGEYFEVESATPGVGINDGVKWSPGGPRNIFVKRKKTIVAETQMVEGREIKIPMIVSDQPRGTSGGEGPDLSHMVPPPLPDPEEAPGDPELESIEEELDPDVNFVVRDVR